MIRNLIFVGFLLLAGQANAGPIGIGDFSGSETVSTFDGLGLPFDNATPLIIDGNTFTTDNGFLRWHSFGAVYGCATGTEECIGNNSDLGYIDVIFGSPVIRAGAFVGISGGTGVAEFYSLTDTLLGSVGTGPGMEFAGWEDLAGISRFRFTDTSSNELISLMDDLRFEGQAEVPAPATLLLFGLGLAGLGWARRKKA